MHLPHRLTTRQKLAQLRRDVRASTRTIWLLVALATFWAWLTADGLAALPAHLAVGVIGTLAAAIDAKTHRLPDLLTIPLAVLTVATLGWAAVLADDPVRWLAAVVGGSLLAACYQCLRWLHPAGLGFGDVKFAVSLGFLAAWRGRDTLILAGIAPFALASLAALALLAARRASRRTALAFGPWMLIGTMLAVGVSAMSA